MKQNILLKRFRLGLFASMCILGGALGGCGDGGGEQQGSYKPPQAEQKPQVVTESDHEKFEKKYLETCVKSQQKDKNSDFTNDQELGKVCTCMAKELSKRISKADAVHFLEKNEFPFDMVMMSDAASNICLSTSK